MGRSKYPRYGGTGKRETDAECAACAKRAIGWATVQVSHQRGEDETYDVCERHHDMVRAGAGDNSALKRFLSHVATKEQWVSAKRTADKEKRRRRA